MNAKASFTNRNGNSRCRSMLLETIAMAAAMAVFFCSLQANAYPPHQGDYAFVHSMPQPSQVLEDMKGTNDLDTAAHQHAALVLLIALVNVSADGTGQIPWPARERQLMSAYNHALPDSNGNRDEMLADSLKLQADDSFVQPFLKRYFSESQLLEIQPMISDFEAHAQRQLGGSDSAPEASASAPGASSSAKPHIFADEHFQIDIPDKWNDTTQPGELVSADAGDNTGISIFVKPLGEGYAIRLSDLCDNVEATLVKNGMQTVRKGTFHFHGIPSGFITSKGKNEGVDRFMEQIFFVQGTDVITIAMVGVNDPWQDPQFKQILDTFSLIPSGAGTPP